MVVGLGLCLMGRTELGQGRKLGGIAGTAASQGRRAECGWARDATDVGEGFCGWMAQAHCKPVAPTLLSHGPAWRACNPICTRRVFTASSPLFVASNTGPSNLVIYSPVQVGLVSQEPTLFATTIFENIAMGRKGATEQEVRAAAEAANALRFISNLPLQFDTQV